LANICAIFHIGSILVQYCTNGCATRVHLVTRAHFRSRDKDDTHTSHHSIRIPAIADITCRTQTWWLCFVEPELLLIEIIHCRNRDFLPFSVPVWPWLWLDDLDDELDPYSLYTGCANINFYLRQGFRKLSSDRQAGR